MTEEYYWVIILLGSYVIGSVPFGLAISILFKRIDIRQTGSGRTGATNVMRAMGTAAGITTMFLDGLKAAVTVWIAKEILPDSSWLHILAPIVATLGHNYSIFLRVKDRTGKWQIGGGAGGSPAVGGAIGLWLPNIYILLPAGLLILFGIGYASLATMSMPLIASIVFAIRAYLRLSPWHYVWYGIITQVILLIALRPNIIRLIDGNERLIGWRAKRREKQD